MGTYGRLGRIAAIVSLVAAMAENRVIGRGGTLPWRLPKDLQHFKRVTLDHTVIMGRKTFESIGRSLPGRTSLVVTRQPGWASEGVLVAHSVEEALDAMVGLDGPEAWALREAFADRAERDRRHLSRGLSPVLLGEDRR